jgi:hypothetical protein
MGFNNRVLGDSNGLRYTRQPRCIIRAKKTRLIAALSQGAAPPSGRRLCLIVALRHIAVVRRRGDLQQPADRLDLEWCAIRVDERENGLNRRSSSAITLAGVAPGANKRATACSLYSGENRHLVYLVIASLPIGRYVTDRSHIQGQRRSRVEHPGRTLQPAARP